MHQHYRSQIIHIFIIEFINVIIAHEILIFHTNQMNNFIVTIFDEENFDFKGCAQIKSLIY